VPDLRELDSKGLAEFLACGCVLQNRTLFRGISLLPPGSVWTFVPGRPLRKELYFKRERWEQQPTLELPEYFEQFKHTWKRILPRYFRGRERIGLSLTGGVDSRMILAWSPPVEGGLSCYTFGGKYRECADVAISRKVAESCHLKHEVLKIDDEFLSRFPELAPKAVYVSDGGMDVTGSIDLYLQQRARQIAPVRVTGTNGGEILRSLVVFKPNSLCGGVFTPELERLGGETMAAYQQELQGNPLSFTAFKQAPWYMGSKFILERSLVTLRMPYFDNDLISLVYRAPSELRAGNDFSRRLIAEGNPALARIVTDLGGSGVSASPLARLRRLFQEFTFKAEYAYDYGMPQWLARLEPVLGPLHLERLFLGRHKIHHFRLFYRNELSAYLKEILLDGRAARRGYLRDGCLERVVNEHLRGHRNHTREIHKLLTLELVHRSLLEQI
jgi:asparagine synthase (glutamine-hydrolysing)